MTARRTKQHGPAREFQPDEIEHFARFREQRADQRPQQCTRTSPCWVEDGPPALNGPCCRTCHSRPDSLRRWAVPLALLLGFLINAPASAERSYDPQILVLKFADGRREEVTATSADTCAAAVKAIGEKKQVFLGPHPVAAHCEPGGRFAPCSQVIVGFNAPAACSSGGSR